MFHEAGFFKILQPRESVGFELPMRVMVDVIFEVASACGAAGWVLAIVGIHMWDVSRFRSCLQSAAAMACAMAIAALAFRGMAAAATHTCFDFNAYGPRYGVQALNAPTS